MRGGGQHVQFTGGKAAGLENRLDDASQLEAGRKANLHGRQQVRLSRSWFGMAEDVERQHERPNSPGVILTRLETCVEQLQRVLVNELCTKTARVDVRGERSHVREETSALTRSLGYLANRSGWTAK